MAEKIKFVSLNELLDHVDGEHVPKMLRDEAPDVDFGDSEGYVFEYCEPKDETDGAVLQDGVEPVMEAYRDAVLDFLRVSESQEGRDEHAPALAARYKALEPFVRAKTHYHRTGALASL